MFLIINLKLFIGLCLIESLEECNFSLKNYRIYEYLIIFIKEYIMFYWVNVRGKIYSMINISFCIY